MMITLVTSNPGKLRELKEITKNRLELNSESVDIVEIQSMDLKEIVVDKAKKAFAVIGGPVIVEDVSAGLDGLGGLPGPFYKYFRERLGDIVLVKLSELADNKVTIQCTAAYYDGERLLIGEGILHASVVNPRGDRGFGFDPVIVPDGQNRTMAEMTVEEKNKISHRGLAFKHLIAQL